MITGEPREKTNKPIKMSFNATSLFTVYHSDCVLASTLPRIPTTKCHRGLRAHKDHVSAQRGRVSKRFSSAICAKSSIIHGTASHVHFSWLSRLSQAVSASMPRASKRSKRLQSPRGNPISAPRCPALNLALRGRLSIVSRHARGTKNLSAVRAVTFNRVCDFFPHF